MRRRPNKKVIENRFEPIGTEGKWEKRISVLECGHTREEVVPAGSKRTATRPRHCYECDRQE